MYLFGLNPTICAKFQHLREPGVSIIAVRCATAGPLIRLLRFYWKPASENSDIYRTFNCVLPPRRPFIKEFPSTPLSRRELDTDFMTQQSLAGGDHKSHRHQVLITLLGYAISMSPSILTWWSYGSVALCQRVRRRRCRHLIQHLIKSAGSIKNPPTSSLASRSHSTGTKITALNFPNIWY